ncbi:MAG: hypothetical protein LUD76_00445 [Alistipes sp.]|nr:hypothetical protein [Alistipes sp.]
MKKFAFTLFALLVMAGAASAQNYKWAGGVRAGGETVGFTVKHKFDSANGLEGILSYPWKNGFTATVLYERHIPVIGEGFEFYYGLGGHTGSWNHRFSLGVDVIAGLEFQIPAVPLALSLDYKPAFNIVKKTKFYMADIALGVKYTF